MPIIQVKLMNAILDGLPVRKQSPVADRRKLVAYFNKHY